MIFITKIIYNNTTARIFFKLVYLYLIPLKSFSHHPLSSTHPRRTLFLLKALKYTPFTLSQATFIIDQQLLRPPRIKKHQRDTSM